MLQDSPDLAVEDGGDSASHGNGDQTLDPGEAAEGRKEIGDGSGRDIPSRKPARARQKAPKRCSVM